MTILRRLLSVVFVIMCFGIVGSISVKAEVLSGKCGDNLVWKLEDDTITISGTGDMYDYNKGSTYDTDSPFLGLEYYEKVIIKNGVTSIGDNAFRGCMIQSVELSDTVKKIGEEAFLSSQLSGEVFIPDSVTTIKTGAFADTSMTTVSGCKNLTDIGEYVFAKCLGEEWDYGQLPCLESINLSEGLKTIGKGMFYGQNLGDIILPDSVEEIKEYAFYQSLGNNILFGKNSHLKSIGEYAFHGCTITVLELPDSLESIDNYAFSNCMFPRVEDNAVYYYDYNFELVTNDNLEYLGEGAFYECEGIKKIVLNDGLKSIPEKAFYNCVGLEEVKISDTMVEIKDQAFNNCSYLKNIDIPDSVTKIGNQVFEGCESLEEAFLGDGLITLPEKIFKDLSSLRKVKVGKNLISIPNGMCEECKNLESINLPDSITTIGECSFYNCGKLTRVILSNNVSLIGEGAFYCCQNITELHLPESISSIESYTFYSCTGLSEVQLPNTVTSIGYEAFAFCSGLTELIIPDSVSVLGVGSFGDCTNLEEVKFGRGVEIIDAQAFENCEKIEKVDLPNGLLKIGKEAFDNTSIKTINLGYTVEEIDSNAFSGSFSSIFFPKSLKSLELDCLSKVQNLEKIYFEGSYSDWQDLVGSQSYYKNNKYFFDQRTVYNCAGDGEAYPISQMAIELLKTVYPYTGNVVIPEVIVTHNDKQLVNEIDYEIISKCKESGDATATIRGLGDYYGTKVIKFKISSVAFKKFEIGLDCHCKAYWETSEGADFIGYEIEYHGPSNGTIIVNDSLSLELNDLTEGNYNFRIRALDEKSNYTAWSNYVSFPIKKVKLVSPQNIGNYQDLIKMPCLIDFGSMVKYNPKANGKIELKSDTNGVISVVNEIDTISNTSTNSDGYMCFYLNKKGDFNQVKSDSDYYMTIDNDVIEYVDDSLESYSVPVFFKGVSAKQWGFHTTSRTYFDILNPKQLIIPDKYYKEMYAPQIWRKIKEIDDGHNGLCFGLCYGSIAWRQKYPGILSLSGPSNSLDNITRSHAGIIDYIERAQIYQYHSHSQLVTKENYNDFQGIYDEVKTLANSKPLGWDIIIGVQGSEGQHALYPLGIIRETSQKVEIAVYDCNCVPDRELIELGYDSALSTFVQKLILYKNESGGFSGYHYPRFDDLIYYQQVGVEIDSNNQQTDTNLLSASFPLQGLEKILSMFGSSTSDLNYYWYNEDVYNYNGGGNGTSESISFTDGYKELVSTVASDRTVSLDLSSDTAIIGPANFNNDKYEITFSLAEDYEHKKDIVVSGRETDDIKLIQKDNDFFLTASPDKEFTVTVVDNDKEVECKTYTSTDEVVKLQASSDGIKAYCDSDGDGSYDEMLIENKDTEDQNEDTTHEKKDQPTVKSNNVTKIILAGISHNIAAGKKIKLEATVLPKNAKNKKLKWTSSNTKVATVTQSGIVTIKKKTGDKFVIIKATATDGSKKSASWKIKVMKGAVKKIAIKGAKKVKAGKALKLKATVKATKGANMKLKWTTSNKKYATVSSSGKVVTKKAGKGKTVKITAMATDGTKKKSVIKFKIQ